MVQVFKSSLADQLSARCGRVRLSAPVRVSVWITGNVTLENANQLKLWGLRIAAWVRWPMRMVPPFFMLAARACGT
jgi:hypothetical protein